MDYLMSDGGKKKQVCMSVISPQGFFFPLLSGSLTVSHTTGRIAPAAAEGVGDPPEDLRTLL